MPKTKKSAPKAAVKAPKQTEAPKKSTPKTGTPVVAAEQRKRREKKTIIATNRTHEKDTGSVQVQVAIMTERIAQLTEHLKVHRKDNNSRRGLLGLVSKRRKLLSYLKLNSKEQYEALVTQLEIRR